LNFTIDTSDLERVRKSFAMFSDRRFNAGLATALTRTAVAVRDAQQAEMRDVFDRPTRYTLQSVFVKGAAADNLVARVGIKDDFTKRSPFKWLRWQIDGGNRTPKAVERLLMQSGAMAADMLMVPGPAARLDAYGNVSAGQMRQILSQLRIEPTQGATSALPRVQVDDNDAARKAKRRRIKGAYTRAGGRYIAFPNGRGKLRPGIYFNDGRNFGRLGYGNSSHMRPVLFFVSKATYQAGRYDFDYVAELAIKRNLQPEVDKAMSDQLRRWSEKTAKQA
jgi:hypothetical protein